MLNYVSTRGGGEPVDFEAAVLKGFADDGGMFVPEWIPRIPRQQLASWRSLSFNDLAFEILSMFIDASIIPPQDLKALIRASTAPFSHPDIIPVKPLSGSNHYIMELFHGPTLSFKDVAMGFLINAMDYFLRRGGRSASLLIATTGDTGPAAAYASIGRKTIDCWVLYPREFISEEQERQITTLGAANVHAVAVEHCPDGGDSLDMVIAELFEDRALVERLRLSSVNSINWCRVLFQSVHYFHGYFRAARTVGDPVAFSVPTGAFGNLFAGFLAREMGLPVAALICANNRNAAVHRVLTTGRFSREGLKQTPSNAIDIALPYNYWRLLYFLSGRDSTAVRRWMSQYREKGGVEFSVQMMEKISQGFMSAAVTDEETLATIAETFQTQGGYLLDPHGAVAVAAAAKLIRQLPEDTRVVSLLTAHPAKFPEVIRRALDLEGDLPAQGRHESIERVKSRFHRLNLCDCSILKEALIEAMSEKP